MNNKTDLNPFTEKVITIIQSIPAGRVMTYSQIANAAGKKRGAREVSWILHSMSRNYNLPWHRVINAQGEITYKGSEQRELLAMEGVICNRNGKIDLSKYQWSPST
ncbi:MGMT family protein [Pseudogracilibacillus sp. SE30717A]|uniref:MGMT family protein n=1 Tax=Pseudogracilibacillus sp. SE30717A TaxID=3098293 RepID=UPI00300DDCCB